MKRIACAAALVLACAPVSLVAEDFRPVKTPDARKPETKRPKEKKERPEEKKPQEKKPGEKKPELMTPWDMAFGAAMMSDYNFRGITQSNHRPSAASYFEPRYNFNDSLQAYAGLSGETISVPNRAPSEIDFYGGIRPTFGSLALDFGAWYYWYTDGECFHNFIRNCFPSLPNGNVVKANLNFWEIYGKASYPVNDRFSLGGGAYWSPSVFNSGAEGTFLAGTARYILPPVLPNGIGWFISADVGHWFLGTSDRFYAVPGFPGGIPYKSYTTWDVGLAFTWKQFTLDLRYYDTDLNKGDCNAFTHDFAAGGVFSTPINPGGPGSNWCGPAFIAKLSIDLSKDNLKKPEGKKPEEKRSEEKKEEQKKTEQRKAWGEIRWGEKGSEENRSEEKRSEEKGAEEEKPEEKRSEQKRSEEKKPEEKKREQKSPEEKKPEEKKPEMKNPWDIASEVSLWSEFNIRGISASGHKPSVVPSFEPRYNFSDSLQAYARLWGNSVRFPNRTAVAINLFAGTRPTFGNLSLDYGYWQRWFPGGQCVITAISGGDCVQKLDLSYWEIFAKATYNVDRQFSFGGGAYWSPSVLNSGDPATYVVGNAKYVFPTIRPFDIGWFMFGEVGHWFREGTPFPSYTNWYAGLAFTWKQFTLDLRYSNTNKIDCNVGRMPNVVATPGPLADECRATFLGKLTVDLTGDGLR